jgi:hypothetical protein
LGDEVDLELSIRRDHLAVTIVNSSLQDERLWDWNCSWGWWSLSIQVREKGGRQIEIHRETRDWTKNGPIYFVLHSRERQERSIELRDGHWAIPELPNGDWQSQPVELRACFQVGPTPESSEFGVFTGTVFSEWVTSMPPHDWLPLGQ